MISTGKTTWSRDYLDKVKWVEFRDTYAGHPATKTADEIELYLLFKQLTNRTVASMERKIK
jgi:hypothetical protein